jgi:hypothetical protein
MLMRTTRRGVASSGCFRGASITEFEYDSFVEVSARGKSSGLGLDAGQKQGRFTCAGDYTNETDSERGPDERAGLTHVSPRERIIIAVTRKKMLCMGDSILGRASDSIDPRLDQCRRLCCDMVHG